MSTHHTPQTKASTFEKKRFQKKNYYLAQEFVCHNCLIFFFFLISFYFTKDSIIPRYTHTQCNEIIFSSLLSLEFKKSTLKASSRKFFFPHFYEVVIAKMELHSRYCLRS